MTGQPVAGVHEAPADTATWRDHVLPSDCLLSGQQMSALAGVAIDNGLDTNIKHSDGTVGHSCNYYATAGGVLSFTATIKVQSPSTGVITEELLADIGQPGATEVPGVGRRMLIEPLTRPGAFPAMRVATDKYLTNVVLVIGNIPGPPDVSAWKKAAAEILKALPA
ncbi:hypothetical protein [Mycolicibacterium neworleansense]|uniref:hypothetical protein n=1 Tax=Mycolicibacterium neworleansense TaxID=146018 RepID=UPI0010392860|nr:hypothetical protein [Mycolicibacterium neworleansense]MCV7364486.1 hypothetical protein [Mycolicibacterium neworleansense]